MSPSSVTVHSAPWIETSLSRKDHGISYDLPFCAWPELHLLTPFCSLGDYLPKHPLKASFDASAFGNSPPYESCSHHTDYMIWNCLLLFSPTWPWPLESRDCDFFFTCESQSYNACLKHWLNKVFQKGEKILQGLTNSWRIKALQWTSEHGTWLQILYQDFYRMLQWEDPCDMRNF